MNFLIIPLDGIGFDPWTKFNNKDEWEHYINCFAPYDAPYRPPDKFPCWARLIQTITNPNGADYMIFIFIYDFKEKEVYEGEECDPVFMI